METEKALKEPYPHLYFEFLKQVDLGGVFFPEIYAGAGTPQPLNHHPEGNVWNHQMLCLKQGKVIDASPKLLWAALCHDLGKAQCHIERGNLHGHEGVGEVIVDALCDRLKTPKDYKDLAKKVCVWHTHVHKTFEMKPNKIMKLFDGLNCFRKDILNDFLNCCWMDATGRTGKGGDAYPQMEYVYRCFEAAKTVSSKDLIAQGVQGKMLGERLRVEKINKIREVKNKWTS